MSEAPTRAHDLRLLAPAAAVWGAALLATPARPPWRAALAAGLLAGAGLAIWRGLRAGAGRHRSRWPPTTASLAVACLLATAVVASVAAQDVVRHGPMVAQALHDGRVTVELRLDSLPRQVSADAAGAGRIVLDATLLAVASESGEDVRGRSPVTLLAAADWDVPPPGTVIAATAVVRPTDQGERAVALLVVADPEVRTAAPWWRQLGASLRTGLRTAVAGLAPHAAGLLPGIGVGDDSQVPPSLAEAMRDSSLGHLLAVSGAHIALILALVLVAAAGTPVGVRIAVGGCALAGLVVVVGTEPSVVRAAAMGMVALGAIAAGRRSAAIPALSAAVIVLLLTDPWLAAEVGFALSVCATAGIVLLAPRWTTQLTARLGRAGPLAPALAVPLAAQVACLPVLLLVDSGLPTYGVLANALVAPVVPPLTVLALTATVASPFAPGMAHALAWLAQPGTWWIDAVSGWASALPFARLPWPGPPGGLLLALALIAGIWALHAWARRRGLGPVATSRMAGVAVIAASLALTLVAMLPATRAGVVSAAGGGGLDPPANWRLIACDVGQGSALLVSTREEGGGDHGLLIDTGPDNGKAAACVRASGIRTLDALVLTHADLDHVGGLADVLNAVDVDQVLVPVTTDPRMPDVRGQIAATGVPVRQVDTTSPPIQFGAVLATPLWPTPRAVELTAGDGTAESASANDLSLTFWLDTPELTVLAHGDLGGEAQAALLRSLPDWVASPDVLVVAHHGSSDQDDALLEQTAGTVSLISVDADNDYGHPAPDIVRALERAGSYVARTDQCGSIAVAAVPANTTQTRSPTLAVVCPGGSG